MIIFIGPVEVSRIIGMSVTGKHNGGVVMDLAAAEHPDVKIGAVHIHKDEVDKIVRAQPRIRIINGTRHVHRTNRRPTQKGEHRED